MFDLQHHECVPKDPRSACTRDVWACQRIIARLLAQPSAPDGLCHWAAPYLVAEAVPCAIRHYAFTQGCVMFHESFPDSGVGCVVLLGAAAALVTCVGSMPWLDSVAHCAALQQASARAAVRRPMSIGIP